MTQPLVNESVLSPVAAETARASALVRIAALAAGLLLLVGGLLISFGAVLIGAVGMAFVTFVERRRGEQLGRWGGWVAATGAVAVGLALFAGVLMINVPAGTWRQAQHTADSVSASSQRAPPPAWLERIAPGSTRRAAQQPHVPAGVQTVAMIWGVGIALLVMAGLYGTLAWAAGMLLGFAGAGQWPGDNAARAANR